MRKDSIIDAFSGPAMSVFGRASNFTLPPLPYAGDALEPVISATTLSFHYGKHHQAYVDNLNRLTREPAFEGQTLDRIIAAAAGVADRAGVLNNAAQVWNHSFYWSSLQTNGGSEPSGRLADAIRSAFGSYGAFRNRFAEICISHFGSGWGWLVAERGRVKLMSTANADVPMSSGVTPLLAIDVWEHAYYLDYQHRRADYVNAVIDHLINWEFAAKNFARATNE